MHSPIIRVLGCVALLAKLGCSDSNEPAGSAGSAGTAGGSGSAGTAGSSGSAGADGSAGLAACEPLTVSGAGAVPSQTRLAFGPDRIAVVWQDDRFGSGLGEIYARVLDGSGNFISEEIRITDDSDASMHPEVVWAEAHFAIGYMGEAAGVLHIATLSAQGEPLSDLAVQGASGSLRDMLAVSDGIALASLGPGAATFQLVDTNGTATADASDVGDAESASEAGPSLARTSNGYALFWDDIRTANHDLRFGAVSSSGQKLGADLVLVDDAAVSRFVRSVSHAGALAIVWQDDPDIIRAATVSEEGTLLVAPTLISEPSQGAPAIASDGARLALLYATGAGPKLDLRTSDLAPLQTMSLAAEPGVYSVDVVATDDGFAATWSATSSVSVALGCAPSRE